MKIQSFILLFALFFCIADASRRSRRRSGKKLVNNFVHVVEDLLDSVNKQAKPIHYGSPSQSPLKRNEACATKSSKS